MKKVFIGINYNEKTIKRLKEMLLPAMAEAYGEQIKDTTQSNRSFEERFTELINTEYDSRVNHTIERYIKNASFMIQQPV